MPNILIINAHEPYPFSEGRLNGTLVERAATLLSEMRHAVRTTVVHDAFEMILWTDGSRPSSFTPRTTS